MRILVVLVVVGAASCLAEAPYPGRKAAQAPYRPSGYRPAGAQFQLPTEFGPPRKEYGPPQSNPRSAPESTTAPPRGDTVEAANDLLMERLRQTPGSERAVYHVYLSDGRLQKVKYTAAPLAQFQVKNKDNYFLKQSSELQAVQNDYLPPTKPEAEVKIASIHFMDVEPISGPIYNVDRKQLTRILRMTGLVPPPPSATYTWGKE